MSDSNNAWHRLQRAMRQVDPANPDGAWQMIITGTANMIGGGTGGTSMVDNNPFTPGGTSITPAGGYVGGRSIASGNAGAIGLSPSGAVLVHVIAGGAGGGLAQLQVVGSDNSNFNNVGFPSGGSPTYNSVPVLVMNPSAAGGGTSTVNINGAVGILGEIGSVHVYGSVRATILNQVQVYSPAGSMAIVGSVNTINMGGSVGVTQIGAPWSVVGSMGVTPLATYTVSIDKIPTVNLGLGTVNIGNAHGITGSVSILGTVNIGGQPLSVVGSVNATNLGGSVGVVQITSPWAVTGSVGATGLGGSVGAVNAGGSVFSYIDARGLTTPTTWQLNFGGSGYLAVSVASTNPGKSSKINGLMLISTGTVDITFQSPSGTFLTGSMRILPGAGIAMPPVSHWPIFQSASNATLFIHATGTQNIGGALQGYIE